MKNKKEFPSKTASLIVLSSVTIFLILLVSIALAGTIVFLLFYFDILNNFDEINLQRATIILGLTSLVFGTIVVSLFSSRLIKPFDSISRGMHQLANGDFKTRVKIRGLFNLAIFNDLNNNFNDMASKLESTELLRTNFINDFSHEFKTPISSLKGFAKILKNSNLDEKERQEYLDIIISESDRLLNLSKNVLTLSKVENQTQLTDITNYNLTEQIRNSIILLQNKWNAKHITLNIDLDEIFFNGNEELLNLVWINIIDNSIKFTNDYGIINIDLTENESSIKFVVSDNGLGMTTEEQTKIFEKFYQADSSHSTEGNGIGLTLVGQIVKLHGGLITVESKVNVGTTITITLPKIF